MMEILTPLFLGFIAFFIGLLRYLPLRPNERAPEWLIAIISIIVLLIFAAGITGLITESLEGYGRMFVFYSGTVAAYVLSRLIPRREREVPQLPPHYLALSRQADETFQAMKAEVARGGEPSQQDALKLESYARKMAELDQAGPKPRTMKQLNLALVIGTGLFVLYLVIAYLKV